MNRRDLLRGAVATAVFTATGRVLAAMPSSALPERRRIRVAFMLGPDSNVIDTAGPWEVFQDVVVPTGSDNHPFQLYTVGATSEIVRLTGGLQVRPDYTVRNAPQPNVIVVPAQRTTQALLTWLRQASRGADVTISVCTGAFQLARAGLLEGIPATTHHQFWDNFAREFPSIELRRGLRFVDSGRIATAGGLTSGIDMALHIVKRYFGDDVAEATARYMEHSGGAWRDGR
jgi:transcriptional regulator GlxA family with amidase domain